MKEITRAQLAELIKNDEGIAYVAAGHTPWHIIGLVSSVLSMKLEKKRGVLLVTDTVDLRSLSLIENNIAIYKLASEKEFNVLELFLFYLNHFIYSLIGALRKKSKSFYIIAPMRITMLSSFLHRELKDRVISNCLYDEGLSTYFPSDHFNTTAKLLCFKEMSFLMRLFVDIKQFYLNTICLNLFNLTQSVKVNCLFLQENKQLIINEEILPFYKRALEENRKEVLFDKLIFENVIVITCSAWIRDEVAENADTQVLKQLMDLLIVRGVKFVVKLHPRDTWTRKICAEYKQFIYSDNSISTENIFAALDVKPRCVIGFSSTTLVTAKLFWNIPAYNVSDIVDNSQLSQLYVNEKRYFNEVFGHYIESPASIDGLFAQLENI